MSDWSPEYNTDYAELVSNSHQNHCIIIIVTFHRQVEPSRDTSLAQSNLYSLSSLYSDSSQVLYCLHISERNHVQFHVSVLTMMLMSYARYMARGSQNQHGFHKPPSLNHRQKLQKLQEQMVRKTNFD